MKSDPLEGCVRGQGGRRGSARLNGEKAEEQREREKGRGREREGEGKQEGDGEQTGERKRASE